MKNTKVWDRTLGGYAIVESQLCNVTYLRYLAPIKGTITITGGRYRAIPTRVFNSERFHATQNKCQDVLPEITRDSREF